MDGNPFKTQLFNAISMSFPFGEAYFVSSFKQIQNSGLIKNPKLSRDISLFNAQEAMHSSIHLEFNDYLASKGLKFTLEGVFRARHKLFKPIHNIKTQLSITMAYEHITATLAWGNLKYGWADDVKDENIRRMWNWHSAEEIEHKSVAYELYEEVHGGYLRRAYGMLFAMSCFILDYPAQTIINLWKTNNLFQLKTLTGAIVFLFGRVGIFWIISRAFLTYFNPRWRPNKAGDKYALQWLENHASEYTILKE